MNYDPVTVSRLAAQLPLELPSLDWIVDKSRVDRLSQDFYWFSPALKRDLDGKVADVAVRPRTEEEIRLVVAACARDGIPITLRGSGTGNYGQSIPLHGGVVLDLSGYNGFGWVRDGVGRAQAGMRLADFDKQSRPAGWELRWLPSTYRTATLGGLFGGGFGGAGSITYGPLAAPGNVLGVRVMTVEPAPQVLELRGAEAMLLHHVYGANGIVLEMEMALAPATPWMECIASFASFDAAIGFASQVTAAPGVVKKEVCFMSAQTASYMSSLADFMPAGRHVVLLVVAESSEEAMLDMMAAADGVVTYRKTAAELRTISRTLVEYTWNHTTLHALKVDKSLTYLQTSFDPKRYLEQVKALEAALGGPDGEVLMHLEFLRNREGAYNCSGLQIIRFRSFERLEEIMQIHRDHGVLINNPHVYRVEDGKQGALAPAVFDLKERFDPQGLLNPGKLRGWEARLALKPDTMPASASGAPAADHSATQTAASALDALEMPGAG
ncbi:MAG: FAD-binding protein [Rhizobacter sp.]|nr:FAD-binding protein [Rhizobacter sp.]